MEQEERRKEKHRKMEVEREKMRQGIRDKYAIKKKEEGAPIDFPEGRIGGARKTPEVSLTLIPQISTPTDNLIYD